MKQVVKSVHMTHFYKIQDVLLAVRLGMKMLAMNFAFKFYIQI